MQNTPAKAKLYNPSAIPTILKTARERAKQPEHRTKRWLAEQLGMTERRLTGIEDGTSQIHLEECIEWCEAVEDPEATEQIMHIYGIGLPPTDPRLLENVSDQLDNLKPEIEEAFQAAKQIEQLSQRWRPWKGFKEHDQQLVESTAKQIFDIKHAAECLLTAMDHEWGLNQQHVEATWINGAIANDVVMRSVSEYQKLRRGANRSRKNGATWRIKIMLITDFKDFMDELEHLPTLLQKKIQEDVHAISYFQAADIHESDLVARVYIFANDDWICSFTFQKNMPFDEVKVKDICRHEIYVLSRIEKRLEEEK